MAECYGLRTTFYNRYVLWGLKGVWKTVFDALARETEDSLLFIDSSIIKAHRAAAGSKRGGLEEGIEGVGGTPPKMASYFPIQFR
ncbi:MAG: hypothetical protein CMI96_04605 [Pelagibacteraceae bacterium]|nr:hypothetical protein [Pelagibacteraceae bacterium]